MTGTLITPRVERWMRDGRPARVLHLFDEACNCVNDRGEVVSLVSPRVGPGPFTIVLAGDFTAGLDVHQPISTDPAYRTLTIGPLVVDVNGAAVWQPKPDWARLRAANVADWPPAAELPPDVDAYLSRTIDGMMTGDPAELLAGVAGLAGRGRGLTPTGDDVLMGVLYALWVWYPLREWPARIVATAAPRTTTLSANFLRAAADGEASRPWHDLADGRPDAVGRILAVGHTSGADAWAGFVRAGLGLFDAARGQYAASSF